MSREDEDLAVRYLENLPKVPRFSMIIMCLSSTDKAGMSFVNILLLYHIPNDWCLSILHILELCYLASCQFLHTLEHAMHLLSPPQGTCLYIWYMVFLNALQYSPWYFVDPCPDDLLSCTLAYSTDAWSGTTLTCILQYGLVIIVRTFFFPPFTTELAKIWDEVFSRGTSENAKILYALRLKYGLKQWGRPSLAWWPEHFEVCTCSEAWLWASITTILAALFMAFYRERLGNQYALMCLCIHWILNHVALMKWAWWTIKLAFFLFL